MSDINDEVHAVAEHLRRLNLEFDRYGTLTAQSADAIRRRSAAEVYRDQQLTQSGMSAAQSLQSLGKAVGSAAGAMYEGRQGATAFNDSIASMNMAVKQAAIALTLLTPGGIAVKAVVGALAAIGLAAFDTVQKLNEMGREMLDTSYASYKKLSDAGATTSEGLQQVADSARKTGTNMLKMDDYLNLIASNSKNLAVFGNTVANGRKKFDDLGAAMEGERANFFKLGFTQETMNEAMMDFVRLQTISGNAQNKNVTQLAASTKNYLYEQDALTKLTGQTRKEQTAIREAALNEQRFRAKMDEMKESGDPAQIKAAEEIERTNVILSKLSPELAAAFRDTQSGAITSEAGQKGVTSTQGLILQVNRDLQAGLLTAEEASEKLARAAGEYGKAMRMPAQLGIQDNSGIRYVETQELNKYAASDPVARKKQIEQSQKDTVGGPGAAPGSGDANLQKYADLLRQQQQAMTNLQQAIFKGFDVGPLQVGVGAALKDFEKNVQKAVLDAINDYFAAFGKNPAAPKPAIDAAARQNSIKDQAVLDNAMEARGEALREVRIITDQIAKLKEKFSKAEGNKNEENAVLAEGVKANELLKAAKAKLDAADAAFKAAQAKVEADAREKPVVVTPPPPVVVTPPPPPGETKEAEQARIKKESEAKAAEAEKAKAAEAAKKAADEAAAKKAAEESKKKEEAKETAKISLLPNGARVLDDVLELVKQGVPVISNVRTQEEQDKLKDHQDEKGNWFTKNNLPVAEDSKHLTGDAIDVRTKDMTKDLEKLLKDSGWMRPLPKSDPGHWQRVPKKEDKKTSQVAPNDVDLATALSQAFDMSDATAGLTINSDVATLNSKGMNVSLDNSADVAKMIATMSPDLAEAFRSSSQTDQSAAKANFESSMGDVKSALSEQKATNVALLDAMQELIRIQKNSVDVQQKIYNVTA